MKYWGSICLLALFVLGMAGVAAAELQQVEVGGSVRLRHNYINNEFTTRQMPALRYGPLATLFRPIGGPFAPVVATIYDWDDAGEDFMITEQRTRLHVKASFTDDVSAFIEFDSYDYWGEDFRSDYYTGVDGRAVSSDDIELFQGYIEADRMWGTPLRLRIGRQEMAFGSQWLVGTGDFAFLYTGLSFDGARLTYQGDSFVVDAFATKLAENFGDIGDGDIDFYGIYASCIAVEGHTFDLYWMLLRDDTELQRRFTSFDDSMLHTIGARASGLIGSFDYDAEFAYQFGDAEHLGLTFRDRDAEWDNWAAKLDLGYTFDASWHPRVFTQWRYYGGEDNRDITFWDWINPFQRFDASVSFNRLFSNEIASGFVDNQNDLTNAWWGRIGVNFAPTEKIRAAFFVSYYETLETFDRPAAPIFSFWTRESADDLGWEVTLFTEYHYSEDLIFEIGWTHLFTGDGLRDGNFSNWNGTLFNGGTDDDGGDYAYFGCKIFF